MVSKFPARRKQPSKMEGRVAFAAVVAVAMATLTCFNSCPASATTGSGSLRYGPLRLDLTQPVTATASTYHNLLQGLRDRLSSQGTIRSHSIPVMLPLTAIAPDQRFVLVSLTSENAETMVLAIDSYTSYIVGYKAGSSAFILSDATAASYSLFSSSTQYSITFGSTNYGDLERSAEKSRGQIHLGFGELSAAIDTLCHTSTSSAAVASALLVVCQMITDASRFYSIELALTLTINADKGTYGDVLPDTVWLNMEDSWGLLSGQLQQSSQGAFGTTIYLQPGNGYNSFSRVKDVLLPSVAFLSLRRCYYPCTAPEPNYIIVGGAVSDGQYHRSAWCIDVYGNLYVDGRTVTSYPCSGTPNQYWRIRSDGTIRDTSDVWCLGVSTFMGQYPPVQIFNCSIAWDEATIWKIHDNHTIFHAYTGRPLGVDPTQSDRKLCLFDKNLPLTHFWFPTANIYEDAYVKIVGMNNLCLDTDRKSIWISQCSSSSSTQLWYRFPNGMIATDDGTSGPLCLTGGGYKETITLQACQSTTQIWEWRLDASIVNLDSGYVIDVYGGDPSAKNIITYSYTGSFNQLWRPIFVPTPGTRSFHRTYLSPSLGTCLLDSTNHHFPYSSQNFTSLL